MKPTDVTISIINSSFSKHTVSRDVLIKELEKYENKLNGEAMRRLKISDIEMWENQFACFMGHKFRILNMLEST